MCKSLLLLTRLGTPDFISKFNPFATGYSEEKATKTLTVFKMKKKKKSIQVFEMKINLHVLQTPYVIMKYIVTRRILQ